jgi:GT2 family glycosyltransferase/glycosyltransferase involved in cell wall biosynthesis
MSLELPSLDFQPRFFSGGPSRFHLPFLYDVIASHRPRQVVVLGFGREELHFAICQAAREQKLTTRCLTIRRSRLGENPEEDKAWRKAVENSEEFFSDVGTLLARDPFAEAAEHADRSVDLLLIDDCDSAATLRDELRAWQPKLSANALVLMHGTLLEREESPWTIWQEFSEGRPTHNFEQGIGLGVTSFGAETPPKNSPLAHLFASAEVRHDLLIVYDIIAGRIDALHRLGEAEREKSALQLRQAWLDTLLLDRWKAQEVMDHLGREVTHLREVIDAGGHDPQATARAFADLRRDRAKAQLIMDAQAEQLKQWVSRSEVLKAKIEEQKRVLDAARNACRKDGKCFRASVDGSRKERRSVPERIIRELRRIPKNLRRLTKVKADSLGELPVEEEVAIDRYAKWIMEHEPDAAALEGQRARAATLKVHPKISLLLPIYDAPAAFLDELLTSLAAQTYGNFEICAVDGGSSKAATIECLKTWQQKEPRLRVDFLSENLGIAENTNRALALASGDFIACIDHDDRLAPFAFYEVADAIARNPAGEIFYSDEDRLSIEGERHSPFFKPEWSPEYLLSSMYLGHLTVYRRGLVERVGKFRKEFELSQDYDFALRATEQAGAIVHIPHVLYHWREHSASGSAGGKPEARKTNLAALAAAMERRGLAAEIIEHPTANRARLKIDQWPKVSIVIPTDSTERGSFLVQELPKTTSYPDYEIVIVTNSALAEQLEMVAPKKPEFRFIRYDKPFNFSEKSNRGAEAASGARLIFVNDDVESIQPDWIQNLIEPLENPQVGAVAPKLLYETGKIQHAGLVTGVRGLVGTACHEWPADSTEHANFAQSMRNVSALSGACLAMRRDDFFSLGEWDALNVPTAHSDLDLCFKIREAGLRCVYTPFVTMRHRGHASIGMLEHGTEIPTHDKVSVFLLKRWPEYACHDPYFSDNMRDWLYADSPTPIRMWACDKAKTAPGKLDLLFVSHDLTWSGAPLICFELAKWCKEHGHFVTAMSPEDGPLRRKFIEAGIPLIVDPLIIREHSSFTQFAREFGCVIANTIFGAPVVRTLKAEGVPHIWWIHEGDVAKHFLHKDADLRAALGLADLIVTPDTRSSQLYQPFTNRAIRVLQDGTPDVSAIIPPRAAKTRDDHVNFLLLATIEQRKGQQVFLDALRKLPEEILQKSRFRIVGRPNDVVLSAEIERSARDSAYLSYQESVPHEEALMLIRDTDVVVSASWDETGPLILMEALALGKPILSTTVGAVAENLSVEEAGLFFPPGSVPALAAAIERLVREPELIERLGEKSRGAYEKYFTFDRFAEGFIELLNEVTDQSSATESVRNLARAAETSVKQIDGSEE